MSEINVNGENSSKTKIKNIFSNKKMIIVMVLLALLVILIPIGYALFSHTKNDETSTKIGTIKVDLVEDWPKPGDTVTTGDGEETYDEFGITRKTKKIYGKSVGDMNAYVRVRLIPIIEFNTAADGSGEWRVAPVAQENIVVSVSGNDWVKSGEYWYYKNILEGGENTSDMDISWQVSELPSELAENPVRTNVRVILEYAQTTNDMWKDLFQIESLPQGVELVQE
ncbi:MAG: hypothetical protein IJ890_09410 [Clostridia bacterium]|nr:hypothetical protein [Clostridia bacterium]